MLRQILKIGAASVAATSVMTLFSYALSGVFRENYREPVMLSRVIRRERGGGKGHKQLAGWLAHYAVGAAWATLYEQSGNGRVSSKAGRVISFGIGTGGVSMIAWRMLLDRHPQLLKEVSASFFIQLLPAHIVYAYVLEECAKNQ